MYVFIYFTLCQHSTERGRGAGVEYFDVLHGVRPLEAEPLRVAARAHAHAHNQVVEQEQTARLAFGKRAGLIELL